MADDVNDWQRRQFGGPSVAEALTTSDWPFDDQTCPNCRHSLGRHSVDLGCHVGWDRGEGCECPLSVALQHNPKREADTR